MARTDRPADTQEVAGPEPAGNSSGWSADAPLHPRERRRHERAAARRRQRSPWVWISLGSIVAAAAVAAALIFGKERPEPSAIEDTAGPAVATGAPADLARPRVDDIFGLPVVPAAEDVLHAPEGEPAVASVAAGREPALPPPEPTEPAFVTQLRKRISELPEGRFTYNRLETMWRDVPETVLLRIALESEPAPDIPEALAGQPAAGVTPITPKMSAELRGTAGLKVDPPGPIEKRISYLAPTEWQWTVTPIRAEARELLTLTLYIHLGDGEPYTLSTYRDVIEVEIGWWGKTKDAISAVNPVWAFVVGAIPALWGAFAWLRGRKWRRGEQERKAWRPFGTRVRTTLKGKKL